MASGNNQAPAVITSPGSNVNRPSRYEAPFQWAGDGPSRDRILGWLREAIQEGEWWLNSQQGPKFVDASHRIMADIGFDELPPTLSKASLNFVKRDVRELIATLSNPRPIAAFKTENPAYDNQGDILNKLWMSWYYNAFVDRQLRAGLQYMGVEGTGYLQIGWDPNYWTPGQGDISLRPLGVDGFLPIQISPDGWDYQKAYACIIRYQEPITALMRRFPLHRHLLVPDFDTTPRLRRILRNLMDRVTPTVHNTWGSQRGYRPEDPGARALVTVYEVYILDAAVNQSGKERVMGVPGSAWEYRVPSYGQQIPTGALDNYGLPLTRMADYHDALLFPYRRHIIATSRAILYDDTSKWWHGKVPVVKLTADDWPFEYAGIPLTKEPAKLQAAVTSLLRAKDDSANARLRPPLAFDGQRVNVTDARSFDPRSGGQTVQIDNMLGEPFKLMVDPRYFQMDTDTLPFIQWLKEEGTRLVGNNDMVAMQKAAQIPSGDTIEKLEELAGPLVTDLGRGMEAAIRDLGEMFKALVFEFYNARRRFQVLGPDGLTQQDFDFDPGELTPADILLPGLGKMGTRAERGRVHMNNFKFTVVPNSIYQMTQSTRRLLILQLARMGLPISPYTVMEQFDIANPGRPPVGPDGKFPTTEVDKWKAWQREQVGVMIEQQMALAQAQMAMQAGAMAMDPLGQLSSAIQQAVQAPTVNGGNPGPGRKPSGAQPPHTEIKDGGTRATVAES